MFKLNKKTIIIAIVVALFLFFVLPGLLKKKSLYDVIGMNIDLSNSRGSNARINTSDQETNAFNPTLTNDVRLSNI